MRYARRAKQDRGTTIAASPLKIGFLGCGRFAQYYHVPALRPCSLAVIAAICDPQPSEAWAGRLKAMPGFALPYDLIPSKDREFDPV